MLTHVLTPLSAVFGIAKPIANGIRGACGNIVCIACDAAVRFSLPMLDISKSNRQSRLPGLPFPAV
jgi:hypothetical protein